MSRKSFAHGKVATSTHWRDIYSAGMRDYPEIHRKVIDDRNQRWLPQIESLLSRGENALIVVGAAHLVGKNGVIELLKGRGYRVEQAIMEAVKNSDRSRWQTG